MEEARAAIITERANVVATTNSGDLQTSLQTALESLSGVKGVSDTLIDSLQTKITQLDTNIVKNSNNIAAMSNLEQKFTENLTKITNEITSLQDGRTELQAQFEDSKNSNDSEAIKAIQKEYGKITNLLSELEKTKATIASQGNQVLTENNAKLTQSLTDAINQLAGSKGVNEQLIVALQNANVAGLQAQINDISDISAALVNNKNAVLYAIANPSEVTIPNLNNIMQVLQNSNNNLINLPAGYLEALKTINDTINTSNFAMLQNVSNILQTQYNSAANSLVKERTELVNDLRDIKGEYTELNKAQKNNNNVIININNQQEFLNSQYGKLQETLSQIQQAQTGATNIQQNIEKLNEAIDTISGQPLFDKLEALRTSVADLPAKYDAVITEISKNTNKYDNAEIGRAIKFTDSELIEAISKALPSNKVITDAVTAAYKGTVNVNVTQDDIEKAIGNKLNFPVPTADSVNKAISTVISERIPTADSITATIKAAIQEQGMQVTIPKESLVAAITDKIDVQVPQNVVTQILANQEQPVDVNNIATLAATAAIAEFKKEMPALITSAVNQAVAQVIQEVVQPQESMVLIPTGKPVDSDASGAPSPLSLPDMARELKTYFEAKDNAEEIKVKKEFSNFTEGLAGCKTEVNQQAIIDSIVAKLKTAEIESPELARVKQELAAYKANYEILQDIIVGSSTWYEKLQTNNGSNKRLRSSTQSTSKQERVT